MAHIPVLFDEVMEALNIQRGGKYVDGTLGRAGHARGVIARGGRVLGIDRDAQALREIGQDRSLRVELGSEALAGPEALTGVLTTVLGRHSEIERIAKENGYDEADGILLDLGVSSPQLDEAGRGFSFLREGPLDMRMSPDGAVTAADIVNEWDEGEIAKILWELGEEREARKIAKAIVRARAQKRIETTTGLAEVVEKAIGRRNGKNPATRTFQALRMQVNDELGELRSALTGGLNILKPGGRMAIITFESLSDRIVKEFFRSHAGKEVSLQAGGSRWEGELPKVKLVNRKAIIASESEMNLNPRSRSAKLRVIEKE